MQKNEEPVVIDKKSQNPIQIPKDSKSSAKFLNLIKTHLTPFYISNADYYMVISHIIIIFIFL